MVGAVMQFAEAGNAVAGHRDRGSTRLSDGNDANLRWKSISKR
jgi:hypothetical protein